MREDMFQQFQMTCDPCRNLKLTIPCHCKKLRACPASNFAFATCQSRQKSQLEPNISSFVYWVWKTMTSMLFRDGEDGPCCGHNSFKFHWSLSFPAQERFQHIKLRDVKRKISKKWKDWMRKIFWEVSASKKQAWGPKTYSRTNPSIYLSIYLSAASIEPFSQCLHYTLNIITIRTW